MAVEWYNQLSASMFLSLHGVIIRFPWREISGVFRGPASGIGSIVRGLPYVMFVSATYDVQ